MISIQNQNKSLGYFRNEEEVRVMNFYLRELALHQGALCLCQAARKYDEIAGALGRFVNFPNPLIPQNLLAPPRQPFSSKFLGVRRWVTQGKCAGDGKPRRKRRSKQVNQTARNMPVPLCTRVYFIVVLKRVCIQEIEVASALAAEVAASKALADAAVGPLPGTPEFAAPREELDAQAPHPLVNFEKPATCAI
jgi:hypothetical protein